MMVFYKAVCTCICTTLYLAVDTVGSICSNGRKILFHLPAQGGSICIVALRGLCSSGADISLH